jgi:hypothetical protein
MTIELNRDLFPYDTTANELTVGTEFLLKAGGSYTVVNNGTFSDEELPLGTHPVTVDDTIGGNVQEIHTTGPRTVIKLHNGMDGSTYTMAVHRDAEVYSS